MPEDYDSDDEPLERNARPIFNQGKQSCIEIFKHAIENRVASKKRLLNHEHRAAAPTTQDIQRRWLNRFQAFLKTLNLTQVPLFNIVSFGRPEKYFWPAADGHNVFLYAQYSNLA
jgi:hypothetical protein